MTEPTSKHQTAAGRQPESRQGRLVWLIIGLGVTIHVTSFIAAQTWLSAREWEHAPIHTAIEVAGGITALSVAWLLLSVYGSRTGTSNRVLTAAALVGMGVLDGLHGLVHPWAGSFVWLHSTATLLGGCLFALLWLPQAWQRRASPMVVLWVGLIALIFGCLSMSLASSLPMMVRLGQFTPAAVGLNLTGGILLLAAAARLLLTYRTSGNPDDLLFVLLCLLFGSAAVMFQRSNLWDFAWWGWHLLRLMAYGVAFGFVVKAARESGRQLQQRVASDARLRAMEEHSQELSRQRLAAIEMAEDAEAARRQAEAAERKQTTTSVRLTEEKHLLNSVLDNIPVPVFFKDLEGRYTRVNLAHAIEAGFEKPEDMVGKTDSDIWTGEFPSDTYSDEQRIIETEIPVINKEEQPVRLDGGQRWVLVTKVPIRDASGRVSGIFGVAQEITQQKIHEQEMQKINDDLEHLNERLQASERRYRRLVEHSAEAIVMLDMDAGRFTDANESAIRLWGVSREQLLASHPADLSPPTQPDGRPSQSASEEFIGQALTEGAAVFDWVHRRADGANVECEVRLHRMPDANRRLIRASVMNNTWRKTLEREVRGALDAAEEANSAKSVFLSNMSHEIRTPMNGIIGTSELLRRTSLDPVQRGYVAAIRDSAEILLQLLNDTLDLSKIDAGRVSLERTVFSLPDCVARSTRILMPMAEQKGLSLVCRVAPKVPQWVIGDAGRLRQVLVNLIGNGVKFTAEGSVEVDVDFASEASVADDDQDHVRLQFEIRDTGIGVPSDKKQIIFQAFEQGDTSTTRLYGGTGLGLAISTQLVQMMNGRLELSSEPGEGSTFAFTAEFQVAKTPDNSCIPDIEVLSDLRVLMIGDDPLNDNRLMASLRQWRMVPTLTDDPVSGIEAFRSALDREQPFRVVLLDCNMVEMGGLDVARQLARAHPEWGDCIVIMLSSALDADETADIADMGVDCLLTKPLIVSELLDAMLDLLTNGEHHVSRPIIHRVPEPFVGDNLPGQPAGDGSETALGAFSILLVEDNRINQLVATGMLQSLGHRFDVVENGREAIDALQKGEYDLVLMDMHMPIMDGYEAIQAIRHGERVSKTHQPIIAMTAEAVRGDRQRCLDAGADEYLTKPVTQNRLQLAIEQLLSDRKRRPVATAQAESAASQPTLVADSQVINLEVARRLIPGGDEGIRELSEVCIRECQRMFAELEQAVSEGNARVIERTAHTIKSSARYFGAAAVAEPALTLEVIGREARPQDAPPVLVELQPRLETFYEALEKLMTEGT